MVVALESSRENAVNLFHSGIFIFSMKNKFRDVIQIQAFELLVFTRIQSETTFRTAGCDAASRVTILGNLVSLGAI